MTDNFEPEVIHGANKLLELLLSKKESDVTKVMQEELTPSEFEHSTKILNKSLNDLGLETAAGAVRAGTGIAKDEAGFPGELGQRSIQALKKTNRLQQCGRGRGKCLIILLDTPLEGEAAVEVATAENEAEPIDPENVPVMLRHVRDTYRSMERQLKASAREQKALEKKVEELQKALEEKDQRIDELEVQAKTTAIATWQ